MEIGRIAEELQMPEAGRRWTPARLRHLQGALGEILGRRVTDADPAG